MKKRISLSGSGLSAIVAGSIFMAACTDSSDFKVEGNVSGADGQSVLLEKPGFHGEWNAIDSVKIGKDGKFSFSEPRPAAPEIYRLRISDRYVYFPIDSTETVKLTTRLEEFGHRYELTGSANAENLARFETEFACFASSPASASTDSAASFKRRVYAEYMQPAPGSVVAYHILTKTMADGSPLYDMDGPDDYRYLAAVATGFRQNRPDDPHTAMLEGYAIQAMKRKNSEKGRHAEYAATEISLLPISLYNEKGVLTPLTSVTGKGEPVILVFSPLTDAEAPARNKELMDRYRKGGVRIYHVAFDTDQYGWREAASNLPWTTVNDPSANPESAIDYNVSVLPAYFLIDAGGNLVKRGERLKDL